MKAREIESELWEFFGVTQKEESIPPVFDHYRIDAKIDSGGMGTVFRAFDEKNKRPVALKVIRPVVEDEKHEQLVKRFRREARIMARLQHPRIVRVYAFCKQQTGRYGLVMELLEGYTLQRAIDGMKNKNSKWPFGHIREIARQASEGLQVIHKNHIIHRDITPRNIWLVSSPSGQGATRTLSQVKLMDFGLAKDLLSDAQVITQPGRTLGTPGYIAPEQLAGSPCTQSDLYSLAIILCELCFGLGPQTPNNIPWGARSDIPRWFDRVLRSLLSADPDKRLSAAELFEEVDAHTPRVPSKENCISERLPSERLKTLRTLVQSFLTLTSEGKSGIQTGDQIEIVDRMKAHANLSAALGEFFILQLASLLESQFLTAFERLKEECEQTRTSLTQHRLRQSPERRSSERQVSPINDLRERLTPLVNDFERALIPWSKTFRDVPELEVHWQEISGSFRELLHDLRDDVHHLDERKYLKSALDRVESRLCHLEHKIKVLMNIRTDAEAVLLVTLTRSKVIWIA